MNLCYNSHIGVDFMYGIIAAMEIELESLKSMLSDIKTEIISGIEFVSGLFYDKEVVLAVSGVGKVNAATTTEAMILKYNPEFIINTGVGGSLSDKLSICDIAISSNVVEHDMDTSPLGEPRGYISGLDTVMINADENIIFKLENSIKDNEINYITGTIASGDQFINSADKKKEINELFNAVCCEMEGASIGHVCALNNVPFCVLRAISDGADGNSHMSFEEFKKIACENTLKVLKTMFEFYL